MSEEEIFSLKAWQDDGLRIIIPKDEWPNAETIPASSLTLDYFEEDKLTEAELTDFNAFISTIKTPGIVQSLHGILFTALADINSSKKMLMEDEQGM